MKKLKAVIFGITLGLIFFLIIIFVYNFTKDTTDTKTVSSAIPVDLPEVVSLPDCPVNFEDLKAQNSDICAWLSIPGLTLEYPILQSSNTEEDFYLNHGTDKKYLFAGSIYIQKINNPDFSDNNTLIYGHNMLNGSMFGKLKKFRNTEFFNQNETIYIYIPHHILTYRIFSAFIYDDRNIMNSFDFNNEQSYSEFLNSCINPVSGVKNLRSDINVSEKDRIITLSTCAAKDSERYLVVAVLSDDQPCN